MRKRRSVRDVEEAAFEATRQFLGKRVDWLTPAGSKEKMREMREFSYGKIEELLGDEERFSKLPPTKRTEMLRWFKRNSKKQPGRKPGRKPVDHLLRDASIRVAVYRLGNLFPEIPTTSRPHSPTLCACSIVASVLSEDFGIPLSKRGVLHIWFNKSPAKLMPSYTRIRS